MLKKLLEDSKQRLEYFFQEVDLSQIEKAVELCASCSGIIFFTGIGKSGVIAEKIALTLASTGTRALYLPTLNFLHGDIGMISAGDLVFLFSKSGEAEELLNLLPFIHRKHAQTISVTTRPQSRLATRSSFHVHLPMERELCSFDLVPTTSTELQLIFGNILSIALMEKKSFSLSDYALNHPSGSIGKKMTLKVRDLMLHSDQLPLCSSQDTLADALLELTQKRCGLLLAVSPDKTFEGIFTDGDLRRSLQHHGTDILHKHVGSLMTQSAITVSPDTLAWDAMKEMQKNVHKWVMATPVIQEGKVVGLLRMHDIIQSGIA